MNNIIVGMGEALWDVLPEGKKIGGAPANFAYHVSQFGFDKLATYKNISYLMVDCSGTSDIEHQVRLYLTDCLCQMKG